MLLPMQAIQIITQVKATYLTIHSQVIRTLAWAIIVLGFTSVTACSGGGTSYIECGGGGKFACPKGMFCDLGSECGGFDAVGTCRRIPLNCAEETDPEKQVCTCNEKTYSSRCYAHASAQPIAYNGKCIRRQSLKKAKKKHFTFSDTGKDVDASGVEAAGDIIHDQFSPNDGVR